MGIYYRIMGCCWIVIRLSNNWFQLPPCEFSQWWKFVYFFPKTHVMFCWGVVGFCNVMAILCAKVCMPNILRGELLNFRGVSIWIFCQVIAPYPCLYTHTIKIHNMHLYIYIFIAYIYISLYACRFFLSVRPHHSYMTKGQQSVNVWGPANYFADLNSVCQPLSGAATCFPRVSGNSNHPTGEA